MNRYNRKHVGDNYSPFVFWVMGAAIMAYIVFKVVRCKQAINEAQEIEKQQQGFDSNSAYVIVTDSTGKEDTMKLMDFLEKKRLSGDSLVDTNTRVIMPGTLYK